MQTLSRHPALRFRRCANASHRQQAVAHWLCVLSAFWMACLLTPGVEATPRLILPPKPIVRLRPDLTPRAPPPSIEAYSMPADTVLRPDGATYVPALPVTLKGLPAGAIVRVLNVSALQDRTEACAFKSERGDSGPAERTFTAGANGRLTLEVSGHIGRVMTSSDGDLPSGFTGPCRPFIRIAIDSPGAPREILVTGSTFRLAPLTVYRYENTWALRNVLRFQMQADSLGICEGYSLPVGLGAIHPVGVVQFSGDLALTVRSGPLGTACRAVAPPSLLPLELRLKSIDWHVERIGTQCDIGERRLPEGAHPDPVVIVPGAIPSEDPGRHCCSREGAGGDILDFLRVSNPPRSSSQHYLNAMHARLACLPTASNDDGVRVVLRSIEFDGPPGVRFP